MADKVYTSCDEWLGEIENFSLRAERLPEGAEIWVKEAWAQAMRFCSVQRLALQSEIEILKENVRYLEEVVREEMK